MTLTYKVTRQGHVSGLYAIDLLDPTNHGNKKIMFLACIVPEIRKGQLKGHVTLTYKVTRQGHVFGLHAIDSLDPKTLEIKKKIFALSRLLPEIVEW